MVLGDSYRCSVCRDCAGVSSSPPSKFLIAKRSAEISPVPSASGDSIFIDESNVDPSGNLSSFNLTPLGERK